MNAKNEMILRATSPSAFLKTPLAFVIVTSVALISSAAQAQTVKTTHKTAGRVTGSVYCVNGTVTVKGWEHDLVKRNPGLRRFNWTPITAAKPGVMVFRQPGQEQSTKQYHYAKPKVLSYAEMRAAQNFQEQKRREQRAQETAIRMNHSDVSDVQGQIVSTYGSASLSQPATYSTNYSATNNQRKVHGRLISTHL
jgi:hypothetical protein